MAPMSAPSPTPFAARRDAVALLLLLLAVAGVWLAATGRWRAEAWRTPLAYSGDALYYLAMAETSAASGALPFLWKEAPRLNAPHGADWNDFPIVNEPVWSLLGISRRLFGIAGATLWPALLAHLLAALGFYLAARWRGSGRPASAVLALVFALSPYIFRRGFIHLNLAFAWHLPLAVLVGLWAAEEEGLAKRKRGLVAIATAVFCGFQATYYALFFLLLLAGALAAQALAGRWRAMTRPALLGVLTVALAAAGNLDSLTWSWEHGKNPAAVERSLPEVEAYSLKPVELLLPRGRFAPWLGAAADRFYYSQVQRNPESGSAYLGVVGAAALLFLLAATLAALLVPERRRPPPEAWPAIVGFLFAISGGVGTAVAIAGVHVFRAGIRVSILLLAVALLYAARVISGWRPRRQFAALALIAVVALFDQLPRRNLAAEAFEKTLYDGDARMAAELEAAIPGGAIFQLPLAEYPEGKPVGPLEPYELLRFYVHSKTLRFSYGAHKGRGDDLWQREILELPWPEALSRLRQLDFSAIAVYGRAYPDRGAALVAEIEAAGGGPTFSLAPQAIRVILLPPAPPRTTSSETQP